MGEYFGTDGIRGVAGQHPITTDFAMKLGRAAARFFCSDGAPAVVIGRDTRISGEMLEAALVEGITGMGVDVRLAGILPTPGVAYLTASLNAGAGIVVSASHNPYQDNGIKFFNAEGYKPSDEDESAIEAQINSEKPLPAALSPAERGNVSPIDNPLQRYREFLLKKLPDPFSLNGMKIVIDCSNGATYQLAPEILKHLGAKLTLLNILPDGKNINAGCGSEHPEVLAEQLKTTGADAGLAFDGDGDRLIAVDETGRILTGDQLMAVFAADLHKNGKLAGQTVVTTVMSNLGFQACMNAMGIRHVTAGVGDRLVMEKMKAVGAVLGGENSGHLIFSEHHTTGDGLLSALQLLRIMAESGKPLSELAGIMSVFPQTLVNVPVKAKPEISTVGAVRNIIDAVERKLADKGRVLVRYSGTQALCRVMVEAPSQAEADRSAERIAAVIGKELG